MPALTYLNDNEVRAGSSVPDDKECDDLLQEMRLVSGENWIIRVREIRLSRTLLERLRRSPNRTVKLYQLYADCHGEWQVMNMVTPNGGSVFHFSEQSREDAMNFMMGYIGGIQRARYEEKTKDANKS